MEGGETTRGTCSRSVGSRQCKENVTTRVVRNAATAAHTETNAASQTLELVRQKGCVGDADGNDGRPHCKQYKKVGIRIRMRHIREAVVCDARSE